MRIIGGQHAGFIIRPPKNLTARPTTDIAKEALFNILVHQINFEGICVLDLFAGSGGIGLEFASRQAQQVTAIDISNITYRFLKQTTEQLQLNNYTIQKADAFKFLKTTEQPFDVIFADPPYAMQNIDTIVTEVFTKNLLTQNGQLIIEHDKNVSLTKQNLVQNRNYGKTTFSFYAHTQ